MHRVQDIRDNLDRRLKRVEGQVKGIRRMVEEGKNCQDILTQVAAARSALKMVANMALTHYAEECLCNTLGAKDRKSKSAELQKLVQTITRFSD